MLLGDFAVAIWDPDENAVICFRDICGCQPTYYSLSADKFVINLSIEGLLSGGDISREIDDQFVVPALSRIFNHPYRTFLKHVHKIPPAQILTIRPSRVTREFYWRPEDVRPLDYSDPEIVHEKFRALMKQAVKDRLPPQGNVGVHLSGGLDCSAVAILASDILEAESRPAPKAFSWQPPPGAVTPDGQNVYRDLAPEVYAAIETVCDRASLEPLYLPISANDYLQVWKRDDTVNRICGTTYSEWPVQRTAKSLGVQYILTGFGGDEGASFSGRGYAQGMALRGKWMRLYKSAKDEQARPLRFIFRSFINGLEHLLFPEWAFNQYSIEAGNKIARWKSLIRILFKKTRTPFILNDKEKKSAEHMFSYLSSSALKKKNALPPWKTPRLTSARSALKGAFNLGNLTYRIESWANDGGRQGIRYLYPMLDKRIIELVFGLPEHAFSNGRQRRLFYKAAMRPILPLSVCTQTKMVEMARVTNGLPAIKQALAEYGNKLRSGKLDMARAGYVDIDRLLHTLSPQALESRDYLAKVLFAVQFLGMNEK